MLDFLTKHRTTLAVVAGATLYATLRYNVLKGTPWSDWPTYVLNKAFSLSALILLMLCAVRKEADGAEEMLDAAGALILAHVALSFALLSPSYYPTLFQGERLSAPANWSLLLGVSALVREVSVSKASANQTVVSASVVSMIAFVAGLHAALLGFQSWLDPAHWPGYLPPITLIAFMSGALALVSSKNNGPK